MHHRTAVLTLALLWTAGSSVVFAESDSRLTVSVTFPTICTVAVSPGEWTADEAIDVQCRNLPDGHPEPLVSDAAAMLAEDADALTDGATMMVINF